ncbi:hypothetical protein KXX11_004027, partial [Aspergillus fumigatus]
ARRLLDAGAGGRAEVQADQPRIDGREEVAPEHREQPAGGQAEQQEARNEATAARQQGTEDQHIAAAQVLEAGVKAQVQAPQDMGAAAFVARGVAHQQHHQGRHQGARQQVRGQHGEHHGLRQRHEQEARHAREEEHRHEHDADAQRGDEGRRAGDVVAGAVQVQQHGRVGRLGLATQPQA